MNSSSCDIFPFILRLLIEPKENSSAHEEFQLLRSQLTHFVQLIESSFVLS